jgi:single-strand DNA-binding protein
MLRMQVNGYLGESPELKELPDGKSVLNFPVAETQKFKNGKGEMVEKTTWISCSYFIKYNPEKVMAALQKGTRIYVEGEPKAYGYTSKDGEIKGALNLNVRKFEF